MRVILSRGDGEGAGGAGMTPPSFRAPQSARNLGGEPPPPPRFLAVFAARNDRVRGFLAALGMTLVLSCSAAEPAQQHRAADSARRPAGVMSADGADWLERPERDVEDRPDIVLAAMKLKNGDVIADVGAGSGYFSRKLARAVGPRGIVYATDIQPEMLTLLRKNAARDRITNIVPILGTASDPGLPKNTLDWILLVDVYHEFQEPQAMLAKLKQSLKKSGRVALVEYRAEGRTAEHIREEHRMSEEQVLREWLPEGFKLVEISEALPSQRLYIFEQQPPG